MPLELPQGPCIFCERIAGQHPERWAVITEDDLTLSVVNPRQREEGQAMVIPRRHAPTILELSEEEAAALMRAAHRVASALVRSFDPDGITIYQNNGVASHQEIPHVHMHVVPRRYGSGWGEGPPHLAALTRADREERFRSEAVPVARLHALAQQVRAAL